MIGFGETVLLVSVFVIFWKFRDIASALQGTGKAVQNFKKALRGESTNAMRDVTPPKDY